MPTAPITGGTSGIGKASALLLHNQGYGVAITGQNPDNLTAAQRELPNDVLVVRAGRPPDSGRGPPRPAARRI